MRTLPGLAAGYVAEDNPFGLPHRTMDAEGTLLWDPAMEWTGGGLVACAGLGGAKPAWEQPPPPPSEAPIVAEGALTRVELDNGLELMLLEDDRLPLVRVGLTFKRGAAVEALEQAGLAQLTSELLAPYDACLNALSPWYSHQTGGKTPSR